MKKKTTDIFIKEAIDVHGSKYNYDDVLYINSYTKVKIKCLKHGYFFQNPNSHLKKINGCKLCDIDRKRNIQTFTTSTFIKKAEKIHNDKNYIYNYENVNYIDAKTKVEIICEKHGSFFQTPDNFLNKKTICPKCAIEKNLKNRTHTNDIFIKKAIHIHNDTYRYENVDYINTKTKVEIICEKHGPFFQTPNNHLTKEQGCPICKESKGEKKISMFLKSVDILFEKEKILDNNLRIDFYIPLLNLAIEYDGIQHYEIVEHFGGEQEFKNRIERDVLKNEYCLKHNIKLIRIPYWEYNNIEHILSNVICEMID